MRRREDSRTEAGDRLWEEYFMKYHNMVLRNASLWVNDYHTAEDICQETFIRLLIHMDKVPPAKIKGWLICVSDHLALDVLRKHQRWDLAKDRLIEAFEKKRSQEPDSILEQMEEFQETGMALKALKDVRPNWYEAIRMSCLEDMDARSIGKELGVRPMLVSKWKERGRRWLRDVYLKKKDG